MTKHPIAAAFVFGVVLAHATAGADEKSNTPYRRLPQFDAAVRACQPDPTAYQIGSQRDLDEAMARWERQCSRPGESKERKARFLGLLRSTKIDFQRESLVFLAGWYGTGMARASLALSVGKEDVVDAAVTWGVPPPPVTPDTAVYHYAFAVDKARIHAVNVTVDGRQTTLLHIAK